MHRRGRGHMPMKSPGLPKDFWKTLYRIWGYVAKYRSLLFSIFIMIILSTAFGLLGPLLVGMAIDRYIVDLKQSGFLFILFLLVGCYFLFSLTTWLQNFWMIGVAQRTVYTMRKNLFEQLHQLPIQYFVKRQHGELMSRITNDIENVSQTLNQSFIQICSSVLTFIGMITLMIWLSPLLTLITLSIIPFMYFGMKWITKRTGRHFAEQQKNLGVLNGLIEETLSGQKMVKLYSQEQNMIAQFEEKNEKFRDSSYWAQVYSGFIPKLMNVLNNLSFAVIALAGGVFVVHNLITIGVIVTFSEYARQFTRPLNDLANQFNIFLSAVAGARRVFDVLDEQVEEEEALESFQIQKGRIEFSDVYFSYENQGDSEQQSTIDGVSFVIEPGQTLALVGPTGAGKTTIVQLLTRFYEPDRGDVRIDGKSIGEISRSSLRKQMGFVLQDSFLFEGTILDNIRYGDLNASREEVIAAAELANADGFIRRLPDGYDTYLTPEGASLSHGQRQLLSIARAMLADPMILILDEATSSIDTITELRIQEALGRLMKGRTNIVIAHRLNTIQSADTILVLFEGRRIEQGSHAELMQRDGFYRQLYETDLQASS